ncbi:hypothetical protein DENSPDRAFT_849657 [Dentipellis sp. KUC8613]|nr:hypothetical protein DENSPDRAFT_849657 [Dentipellis sp. KUC8613]
MPRAKATRSESVNLEREFDNLFATQSSEHEDLIAQVVEQKQAVWEKKKKTRGVNFVGVLRKEVGRAVNDVVTTDGYMHETTDYMHLQTNQRCAAVRQQEEEAFDILDHLLSDYAENEDVIRSYGAYFHQTHTATRTADAEREAASIRQLAIAKHACEDSEDIVNASGNRSTTA